ncbi:MAG: hypothetical protein UR26_C0001G0007 [candidate division TM6 bacterium GW2011_GWF2_32_72]|nr:MAG: hypothetical protein UR26_C0001G0007 [candidate division TM6 bacterium GW2011_GWF2_32_72]
MKKYLYIPILFFINTMQPSEIQKLQMELTNLKDSLEKLKTNLTNLDKKPIDQLQEDKDFTVQIKTNPKEPWKEIVVTLKKESYSQPFIDQILEFNPNTSCTKFAIFIQEDYRSLNKPPHFIESHCTNDSLNGLIKDINMCLTTCSCPKVPLQRRSEIGQLLLNLIQDSNETEFTFCSDGAAGLLQEFLILREIIKAKNIKKIDIVLIDDMWAVTFRELKTDYLKPSAEPLIKQQNLLLKNGQELFNLTIFNKTIIDQLILFTVLISVLAKHFNKEINFKLYSKLDYYQRDFINQSIKQSRKPIIFTKIDAKRIETKNLIEELQRDIRCITLLQKNDIFYWNNDDSIELMAKIKNVEDLGRNQLLTVEEWRGFKKHSTKDDYMDLKNKKTIKLESVSLTQVKEEFKEKNPAELLRRINNWFCNVKIIE